jgi:hypothetical protein
MVQAQVDFKREKKILYEPNNPYLQTNLRQLKIREQRKIQEIKNYHSKNKKKISRYDNKLKAKKALRTIKRVIKSKNLFKTNAEIRYLSGKVNQLKRSNIRLKKSVGDVREEFYLKRKNLKEKIMPFLQ